MDTEQEITSLKEEIKKLKQELKVHSHDGRGTVLLSTVLKLLPFIEGKFKAQGYEGKTTTYTDKNDNTITVKNGIIV